MCRQRISKFSACHKTLKMKASIAISNISYIMQLHHLLESVTVVVNKDKKRVENLRYLGLQAPEHACPKNKNLFKRIKYVNFQLL